jgi:hypothetical protein
MLVGLPSDYLSPDRQAEAHMRLTISVFVVCTLTSFALGAEQRPGPEASESVTARPIVAAIRWDAWYGRGSPVSEVEKTLGPTKYHFRLPFFAKVISPAAVSIDGDSQQVMEQEISYAASAGLDYWAFVDYWDHANLGIALRRYRAAGDKKGLRFCLIEEGGRIDRIGTSGWPRLVTCFKDPDYQTVLDGRPLLFVFGRPKILGKREFESLAEQAVAAGLGKPYFVFMGWNPAADAQVVKTLAFDAVSAYAAGAGYRWEQWPYEQLTKHVRTSYWDVCRQQRIPTITFATAGWDPRPRVEHPVPWIAVEPRPDPTPPEQQKPLIDAVTATPAQIAQHLQDAIDWTKNNRNLNPANAIIVYGWNENDEGGWLIPTWKPEGQPDRSRLDAVSHVLKR